MQQRGERRNPMLGWMLLMAVWSAAEPAPGNETASGTAIVDPPEIRAASGDYVVLLHGIRRGADSMHNAASYLHLLGYHTVNVGYPSTSASIETCSSDYLAPAVARHCPDPARNIHFVAHSLGCIVVREFLQKRPPANLGRVVFLAAPNRGTELADRLENWESFRAFWGPSAAELGTGPDSLPRRLPPPDYPVGVIMGNASFLPLSGLLLPGEDDGVVPVASGFTEGITDSLVLPLSHGFIRHSQIVHYQTACFLASGSFDHALRDSRRILPVAGPGPRPHRTARRGALPIRALVHF